MMSKSGQNSHQTDNEPNNKSDVSIERALNEVGAQTKAVVNDLLNDKVSPKLNHPQDNARKVINSRDFDLGIGKSSSAAKSAPFDTTPPRSTPTLSENIDDQGEAEKEENGFTEGLDSKSCNEKVSDSKRDKQSLTKHSVHEETKRNKNLDPNIKASDEAANSDGLPLDQTNGDNDTPINGGTPGEKRAIGDSQSAKSVDSTRWGKPFVNKIKTWLGGTTVSRNSEGAQDSSDEDSESMTPDHQLMELPSIPVQFRPREINGFGILSKSQTLPMKTKKQYQNLLNSGLGCTLQFCKYLEIMSEKSKKQDITKSFALQFARMHYELTFTSAYLKTNEDIDTEILLQLKILFNDLFSNNYIIWIVNKFEYDDFGRKFRKTIAQVLRDEFQYDVSYKRERFYRDVVAASLTQWKKNIPFPERVL
ncbi:hypothetical protein CANMA_004802 [Candida margitis]|uniref:uncharacterized protein n=1 Tax=Candida margitis TaxID=1775924 RepID=UPI002226BB5A|nr:uncharacterized protein CANMA_004802 [Candida margitis]KAI5953963.1 hypothetical protein CANMA_004802 [Candida margitis]